MKKYEFSGSLARRSWNLEKLEICRELEISWRAGIKIKGELK